MDNVHRRTPTNKEFKTNFQGLASTKAKKGHLNDQERKKDDKQSTEGTLKRILISKIDDNGWEVVVGKGTDTHTYNCVNPLGGLLIPESELSTNKLYYVPKNKTVVEVDIDKKSHIYTITRIRGQQIPLASFHDKLYLSVDSNTKTNKDVNAEITMSKDDITLQADSVKVKDNDDNEIDLLEENAQQKDDISSLQEENKSLLSRIEILEEQVSSLQSEDDEEEDNENQGEEGNTNNEGDDD